MFGKSKRENWVLAIVICLLGNSLVIPAFLQGSLSPRLNTDKIVSGVEGVVDAFRDIAVNKIITSSSTTVAERGSTLITDVRRALEEVERAGIADQRIEIVCDEGERGQRVFQFKLPSQVSPERKALYTHYLAVWIQNEGVYRGTQRVYIDVGQSWLSVEEIKAVFNQRFNIARRFEGDPLSSWVSDYLSEYNSPISFEILAGRPGYKTSSPIVEELEPETQEESDRTGILIGMDIGSNSTKMVLVKDGEVIADLVVSNRPQEAKDYTSYYLLDQLENGVRTLLGKLQTDMNKIRAIGVAWAGAIRKNRIAASSNILLDLRDIKSDEEIIVEEKYARVKNFSSLISERVGGKPVFLINDGNADAFYSAWRLGLRKVIVLKFGTSLAGGYVDAKGDCEYLAEFSRGVINLSVDAPAHIYTKIKGQARSMLSSVALTEMLKEVGISTYGDETVTPQNSGEIVNKIVKEGVDEVKNKVIQILRELSHNLIYIVDDLSSHFDVDYVIFSGSIADSPAGRIILETANEYLQQYNTPLAHRVSRIVVFSREGGQGEISRYAGAIAATEYAEKKLGDQIDSLLKKFSETEVLWAL